jgi:hypothetical protein
MRRLGYLGLPEVLTADPTVGDEALQGFQGELTAGIHAAVVDAVLVDLGRVDPVEPVHGAVDGEGIGVAGMGRRIGEQKQG